VDRGLLPEIDKKSQISFLVKNFFSHLFKELNLIIYYFKINQSDSKLKSKGERIGL